MTSSLMLRLALIAVCITACLAAPAVEQSAAFRIQTGGDYIQDDGGSVADTNTSTTAYTYRYIEPPPVNKNWDQRDLSSMFQLGYGKVLDSTPIITGATFRSYSGMGDLDGSCQFWQNGVFNFADPGWNPYLTGVGSYFWADSTSCGQCLLIKNPATKFQVVVMITDYCPPPCSSRQLDMQASSSAFLASGNSVNSNPYRGGPENYSKLEVRRVECDWKGEPIHYWFARGSSAFHWYLITAFHTVPITGMTVERIDVKNPSRTLAVGDVRGHDKYGRWVVEFRGDGGAGLYRVRLKGKGQESRPIEDLIYWNGRAGVPVRGNKNFPLTQPATDIDHWPLP